MVLLSFFMSVCTLSRMPTRCVSATSADSSSSPTYRGILTSAEVARTKPRWVWRCSVYNLDCHVSKISTENFFFASRYHRLRFHTPASCCSKSYSPWALLLESWPHNWYKTTTTTYESHLNIWHILLCAHTSLFIISSLSYLWCHIVFVNCCASRAAVTIFGGRASTSIGRGKVGVSASAVAQLLSNGYQVEGKDPFIAAGFRPRREGGECAVVGWRRFV